jgi:hypothetical protein
MTKSRRFLLFFAHFCLFFKFRSFLVIFLCFWNRFSRDKGAACKNLSTLLKTDTVIKCDGFVQKFASIQCGRTLTSLNVPFSAKTGNEEVCDFEKWEF